MSMMHVQNMRLPIELVYEPDNRVIVKFPEGLEGKAEFAENAHMFEEAFRELGIPIPIENRAEYPELNKPEARLIFLEDNSFGKAFYEVYYLQDLDVTKFKWRKI